MSDVTNPAAGRARRVGRADRQLPGHAGAHRTTHPAAGDLRGRGDLRVPGLVARPDPRARLLRDARGRRRRPAGPGDRHLHRHGAGGDGRRGGWRLEHRAAGRAWVGVGPRPRRDLLPRWHGPARGAAGGGCGARPGESRSGRAHDRRAVPRARRPGRAGQRRLQPAHVHVRPVRVRQDLLPGAAAGAGAGGDRAARHHPGPQLRLRGAGPGPGGRRPPGRGPLSAGPGSGGVWGNDERADHPLRLRFAELDTEAQAATLGLDPVRDRDEYAVLADLLRQTQAGKQLVGLDQLEDSDTPGARDLSLRAANLGVLGWDIWAGDQPSVLQELENPSARCTVVDLGSLGRIEEQRLVAQAILSRLWTLRQTRQPCLVVLDEAHNICAADPLDPVGVLSTHRAVQIAAEGRKFGLYLLVSTQRPHKVHEGVVSQCDNALMMRMNSRGRHRGPDQPLLLRPGRAGGRPVVVPHGPGARGRQDLPAERLRPDGCPGVRGGWRGHPHRLGPPPRVLVPRVTPEGDAALVRLARESGHD